MKVNKIRGGGLRVAQIKVFKCKLFRKSTLSIRRISIRHRIIKRIW